MTTIGKRLSAVLLVLALCLSLFPVMASAESEAVSITSLSEITDLSGSYRLADDITVTEPFGSSTERFNGTLDGDGHTVTINITKSGSNIGMFAYLDTNAVVKNFVVDSAQVVNTGSTNTGAIAGTSKGTVSDIRVKELSVSGYEKTGGLVGVQDSGATLTRCCVDAGTVKKSATSDTPFGGLVGENSGTVSFSSSAATMDHSDARPNYDYVGGIVGKNVYGGTISDCYFSGSFNEGSNKSYKIGGICGDASGTIRNCYFSGSLVTETSSKCPIANTSAPNCYYLDTSFTGYVNSGYGTKKTAEEFASLAETLGADWENGTDGFPVLSWQTWKYSTTAIKYKIETYLEDLSGDGYTCSSAVEVKAEPGTPVSAEAQAIEGFTFDADNERNIMSGEASAELVLKLYYTRNSYTLTWETGDYAISDADDAYTHGSVRFGAAIVYPHVTAHGMSVKWDKTLATMPATDTVITADYSPAVYDVAWNANGGKFEKDNGWGGVELVDTLKWTSYGSSGGAIYGQTFGKYKWNANSTSFSNRDLPVPTHSSKVFDGWFTAAEGGTPIDADTAVTEPENGSFTFYAHWTDGWTVTFDPNGGSVTPKTVLVRKGGTLGASVPTPSRSGYDFDGWFNGENKLEADTVIDADATYTARWTPKTYTVSFQANGGEGSMDAQTFTYGVAQKLSKNAFTREGYRFVGWATWSGASSASYGDEAEYSIGAYNQTFYAVWEEVRYDLTIATSPENATVVLKNAAGVEQSGTDGVYHVLVGTYSYTVSAYGYETLTGEIKADETKSVLLTLTKIPTYAVSFSVTKPEGSGETKITVTDAAGRTMTADENGVYQLMSGAYHYVVKAKGAKKAAADFTVETEALHFDITLPVQNGWDGETVTEPHQLTADEATGEYEGMTGWYRVENGEELAWVARKINSGSGGYNANIVLAKDIDLGGELWTPMGSSYNNCFTGIFDGNGHSVTNLFCEGTTYQGLFGYSKGTIRNLTVSGSVTLKTSNASGYEANAGGIVAYQNNGSIDCCASYVTVTNEHASGRTGGIAGYASSTTFLKCFNAGKLSGGISVAGIAGYCGGTSTITDCYNIGTLVGGDNIVESSYTFGQISGIASSLSDYSASTVTNCYNAGAITGAEKYSRVGSLISARGAATLSNCYYLEVDGLKGVGNGLSDGCTAVDAETLASADMPAKLSEAFKQNTGCGGFAPALTWQTLRTHSFTTAASDVVASEATCTQAAACYVKCDVCGAVSDTLTVSVGEALGHDLVTDPAVPATCTESGLTEGSHCTRCDYKVAQEVVPATGHTEAAPVRENEVAATCTEAGSYDEVVYCSVCHAELSRAAKTIDALGHDLVDHEAKAATCTEAGWAAYQTCTRCDYTTYQEIPATGHTEAAPVRENEVAATCTEAGSYDEVVYCSVCHAELSRAAKTIDALGHDLVTDAAVPATCTESGLTEGSHCTRCDYKVAQEVVPATGHTFENGVCTVCGAADPDYVKPEEPWVNPFVDVRESAWYFEGVRYAAQHGLFNGTSATTFEPEADMTRAMLVTVLWRMADQPEPTVEVPFTDTSRTDYYAKAVAWAYENKVVNGTSPTTFEPDGKITREQIATILYRYAEKKGYDVSKQNDLSGYPDADKVSGYARTALAWANALELVKGTNEGGVDYLDPQGHATRAQVATILMRYAENVVK